MLELLQMSLWTQPDHRLPSLDGMEERQQNVHPLLGSPSQYLTLPGHLSLSRLPKTLEVVEQGV